MIRNSNSQSNGFVCFVLLAVIVLLGFSNSSLGHNSIPVPVGHPVYAYLEGMETRGFVFFRANSRPLTRGEIGGYLVEIWEVHSKDPDRYSLTRREKAELFRFTREFSEEEKAFSEQSPSRISKLRNQVWKNSPFYRDGRNLYNLDIGNVEIDLNPVLYWDALADSVGEVIVRRTSGFYFTAELSEQVGCYFNFQDNMETGRGPYNKDERDKLYSDHAGYVTMDGGEVCYYDITRAVMAFRWGNLLVDFGRGDNRWGSGRRGNLLFSDNPPPFDYLSARYDVGEFLRFIYLTGALHPYPEIYQSQDTTVSGRTRNISESKFVAAHRLEIYPCRGVEIGLSESVIYGERGLEPAYLNPLNFYYSAEHNLGDMDNVSWSGDVELNLLRGIALYGEFFIDDMQTRKLGTDYIGNKFAYLGGCFIVNPAGLSDLDITFEYTRIDPFCYTHFFPINTYKNWNSSLGHFLPPNSQEWYLGIRWRPHYCWTAGFSASFTQHGENSEEINAGGDINIPPDQAQVNTQFLAGDKMEIFTSEVMMQWQPLEYYTLQGRWRWNEWTGGCQNEWRITFGVNVW